jgi:hypothetical protein
MKMFPSTLIDLESVLNTFDLSTRQFCKSLRTGDITAITRWIADLIESIDNYSRGSNEALRQMASRLPSGTLGTSQPQISFIGQEPAINYHLEPRYVQRIRRAFQKAGKQGDQANAEKYCKLLFVSEVLLNPVVRHYYASHSHIFSKLRNEIQNPYFPSSFANLNNFDKTRAHTWNKALLILKAKISSLDFNASDLSRSLFRFAEFRDLSSVVSKSNPLAVSKNNVEENFERILAATSRGSSVVVFACTSYLDKYVDEYEREIRNAYKVREIGIPETLTSIQQLKRVFKSSSRTILLTHQLSGSCGWSNDSLQKMGKYLFRG